MSLKEYIVPNWSAAPSAPASSPFYLEVVREGAVVATCPLTKATHFVGRNADVCDIVAEHPSLSRQHAALQFGQNNALFVMDLGSAQGTKVNKKPIAPHEFVLVHVGDILSFAASTRLYIVNGPEDLRPEEYDSANVQAYRASLVQRSERAASRQAAEAREEEAEASRRNEGASWGFGEDAVNDDTEADEDDEQENKNLPDYIKNDENYARKYGEKFSSSVRDGDVHEKDRAVLEKIRAKERKIQNMQEENKKIYMKERSQDAGLTEGQEAAVARNDKRIEALKAEIEELEYSINLKNAQRSSTTGSSNKSGRNASNADDDSLLDTTSATADVSTNWRLRRKLGLAPGGGAGSGATQASGVSLGSSGQAWTYQSLSEKKEAETASLEKTRKAIEDIEAVQDNLGDDDAIDGYLQQAHAAENTESLKRLRAEELSILAKLREIDRLLKIATPALIGLVQPKPSLINKKDDELLRPPVNDRVVAETSKVTATTQEPLKDSNLSDNKLLSKAIPSSSVAPVKEMESPPVEAPSKSSVGQSQKRPAEQDDSHDADYVSSSTDIKPPAKSARVVGPSRPPAAPALSAPVSFDSSKLQDGERVWVPPKNQSGDGRTSLNDKFGY